MIASLVFCTPGCSRCDEEKEDIVEILSVIVRLIEAWALLLSLISSVDQKNT